MFKRPMGLALTFAVGVAASPVLAQAPCGQRAALVERLEAKFSEQLTAGGLQSTRSAQAVLEIWASDETGTFTVLLTSPSGVSCILASGTDFFRSEAKAIVDGTPS